MPNATLDPQDERERLDDLEQQYNAPSAPEKEPVSADDLEAQYNMPSAAEPVYDKSGIEDSKNPKTSADSDDNVDDGAPGPDELEEAESEAGSTSGGRGEPVESLGEYENKVGSGYKRSEKAQGFIRNQLGKHNRIFLIGGGGVGLTVIIAIFLFVTLAPLKILNIVNNLQNRFYATSENAVQHESDVLFSDYMRRTLRKCPGEITKDCNPFTGGGLVSQLYKGWRAAKLEDKLAKDYGIEFKTTKGHYYLKMPGMKGDGANIDSFVHPDQQQLFSLDDYIAKSNDPEFKKVSRSEFRQAYRQALAGETKWKQLFYRYKVGGLLSKKYGLKRCIIACDTRDNFADWKDNKTRAAKLIIVERVLYPRSETLGLVVGCVLSGDCDKTQTDSDGKKTSAVQQRLQARLDQLAAEETGKYADVLGHSTGILKDGYQKYILKAIIRNLGGDSSKFVSEESADKLVPIVGWVNASAKTIGELEKAPQEIRMMSYLTNATAMIGMYTTYRVYADEVKTGNVDPTIAGSFNKVLGPGEKNDMGGAAQAEGSPLYQKLIDGKSNPSSKDVKCNDGKPIPAGKLVCPEEVLGGADSKVISTIENINKDLGPLVSLANAWNSSFGKLFGVAGKIAGSVIGKVAKLPGFSNVVNWVGKAFQPIIDAFVKFIIPSPFGDIRGTASTSSSSASTAFINNLVDPAYAADSGSNSGYMSGARVFDLMAGGADASGNDYAHNGLGGQVLTPAQTASIVNEQLNQGVQDYQKQPVLARLFDTNSPYSLASKIALAMPYNREQVLQSVASFFTNPFSKLSNAFGLMLNPAHAFASASPDADPFGISQYGYLSNDPTLASANQDPPDYWNQQCSSDGTTIDWKKPVNAKWQDAAIAADKNSPDGMPENTTTDPCLLLQAAVGSAGGLYNDSLLGDDQPGVSTPVSDSSTGTSIDTSGLFADSSSISCATGTKDVGVQDGYYQGNKVPVRICAIPGLPSSGEESHDGYGISGANGLAVVNSRVSGAVLAMVQAAKKDGMNLSANSSFRTMTHQQALCNSNSLCLGGNYTRVAKPGTSNHQMGLAIDFSTLPSTPGPVPGNPVWEWLSANAANFGYKNYPAEAWHWSPTGN